MGSLKTTSSDILPYPEYVLQFFKEDVLRQNIYLNNPKQRSYRKKTGCFEFL